jgi:hypothetical protein
MELKIHEEIIYQFNKTLSIFRKYYGNIASEFQNKNYSVTYATYIRAWLGVIYLIVLRIPSSRKYIFQEFKNMELINCLKPENIIILGGKSNYSICLKRGYGLFWTGGISAAVLLAWRSGRMAPLKFQIKLAKNKLNSSKKYFLLYEDTHAVGIFFALLGGRNYHSTVCIQHGIYQLEAPIVDGTLCLYNLVYALSQKVTFEKLMKTFATTFFELGPPFDVNYGSEISNCIVLVGTGEHDMRREFYFRSLDIYIRIKNQLSKCGWTVIYRPHPSESESDYSPYFREADRGSKVACLSGPRKIFIGYISTLLYEAILTGHSVLRLTDPAMKEEITFTPNVTVNPDCIFSIDEVVSGLCSEMKRTDVRKLPPIEDRFISILQKIELESE